MGCILMKRKKVFLLCGCPGSGKSTWVKEQLNKKEGVWCSRDAVRFSQLRDCDEYFDKEASVFDTWINQINQAIENKKGPLNIYVDATHLSEKARNKVLDRLNLKHVDIIPVSFLIPLSICFERNDKREGRAVVPRSVIRKMYYSYKPPTYKEKYEYKKIIEIRE